MWEIQTTDRFDAWFNQLDDTDRANVIANMLVLSHEGPLLSRPYADSIKGSTHANMKELRIQSKGKPIRDFFAFDTSRKGILLCAGHKAGRDKYFYKEMIPIADKEFSEHLKKLQLR